MSENQSRPSRKLRDKVIGTIALFVVGLSAWAGIALSGMGKGWALVFSIVGGILAMIAGMVMAGLRLHDDLLVEKEKVSSQGGEIEKLKEEFVKQRREFGLSAVIMAKSVADNVAARIISRHDRNLPAPEHRDAALKEAGAMVVEEIVSYGERSREES